MHHLRFFPSDLNPQPTTHDQPQTDSDDTTVVIDDDDNDFVYQPKRGQFKHRATPSQSLSLSRIFHMNDSNSDSRDLSSDASLGSGSTSAEQVGSRTPSGMREGDTDDTTSDPAIRGRPARSVRGGEQWFTTSQLGSPSFSSPASVSSMPPLEQPTASFEEGSASSYPASASSSPASSSLHHDSSTTQQNSVDWSSYEEELSTPSASMAYR